MHKRNINANINILQIFIDSVILLISYFVANFIYFILRGNIADSQHVWILIVFGVIFILSMLILHMYDMTTFHYLDRILQRSIGATIIALLCVSTVIFLSKYETASRLFFGLFVSIAFISVLSTRLLVRFLHSARIGNGYTHILFIGSERMCAQYMQYIEKTALKVKVDRRLEFDAPELRTEDTLETLLVSMNGVSEVVLVHGAETASDFDVQSVLDVSEDMGITARLVLDLYELRESKRFVSSIGTLPVLTYHSTSLDKVQIFFKGLMDVIGAAIGLFVFFPVFIATAIAIRLESPGPIFFCQTRVGRNGKKFKMYKFRSMFQDAEERKAELQAQNKIQGGLMFKMDNDPRITKVGNFIRKTSIDELPQLVNVLKRDMSLVGTRPPTVDEVEKYDRHHHRRISIMPGITGMWQVNGRSEILDFEHVVELDKQYIEEWSLGLDIKLIFQTVAAVMVRRGAV